MANFDSTSPQNGYTFRIEVYETLPKDYIETNITYAHVYVKIKNNGIMFASGHWVKYLNINGTDVFNSEGNYIDTQPAKGYGWTTLMVAENQPIQHNADGSKTISISSSIYKKGASYTQWDPGKCSGNVSFKLTTIPRASTITLPEKMTIGSASTITIKRATESFHHTIEILNGNEVIESRTGVGGDVSGLTISYSWTPDLDTYAREIPDSDEKTFTIRCTTYSGNTQIGNSKSDTTKLVVPSSIKPSINTVTHSELNSKMNELKWGIYVKTKSQLQIHVTANIAYNSAIKTYETRVNDDVYYGPYINTPTLNKAGQNTIKCRVIDSRGRPSDYKTIIINVVDYEPPKIIEATVTRCNSNGTDNDDGTYLKYNFVGNIASINNKNSCTFAIDYLNDSGGWSRQFTNNQYSINSKNVVLNGGWSASRSWRLRFTATDSFSTIDTRRTLGTGFDIINVNVSGKSLAIGKMSEASSSEKKLEIALDTNFEGSIKKDGKNILEIVYPVGAIYLSTNETNPNTLFGFGTWERLKSGFLYGANGGYSTGNGTGTSTQSAGGGNTGSAGGGNTGSHTLTINEIPSHGHTVRGNWARDKGSGGWGAVFNNYSGYIFESTSINTYSENTGGGKGHTHTLPNHTHSISSHSHGVPYIAVCVWRRTK